MDQQLQMLKALTDANGVSGFEKEARDVMKSYIAPFADSVETDHLGSLIAKKTGNADGPKIMVAGHLDEIGFMVKSIDEKGFLRFQTIGGWWGQVLLASRVTVITDNGPIPGVIGSKPPHVLSPEARKKPVEIEDMFIDIGATSKEEAQEFGVKPGNPIAPLCEFTVMKNEKLLMAKAWDNRIGCAIAIEVLKSLHDVEHPNVVYGVGTIQEEVGLRGAKTSAHAIQPDIGFAIDVGIGADTPNTKGEGTLGAGPQIILYDGSMIGHKNLRDFVVKTAEENNIPFQYDTISGGGTDGGAIHLTANGVPALSITIATRYIHTHAGLLHRDDYNNTVKLLVELIKRLDGEMVKNITFA
ncbi:peptidase M28 [Shouchella clausii]|nr:peptidase M28 [Shouchella clausii]